MTGLELAHVAQVLKHSGTIVRALSSMAANPLVRRAAKGLPALARVLVVDLLRDHRESLATSWVFQIGGRVFVCAALVVVGLYFDVFASLLLLQVIVSALFAEAVPISWYVAMPLTLAAAAYLWAVGRQSIRLARSIRNDLVHRRAELCRPAATAAV
jgi:hypothetical protein